MARRAWLIGAKTLGLQFADRDVEHMQMALEQHGYEVAIIEPIRSVINNNLDKLVDEVGQTDTVLIYFSGHAVLDNGLRLVLQDNYQSRSGRFEVDDIIKALNECKTKQKVLILDCCHANAGTQDWNLDLSESFSILTASGRLEKAKEIEALQGSFFTHHFVRILNQAQDYAANDVVYLHSIYDAIDAAALAYNREHPDAVVPRPSLLGNRQHTLAIAHLVGQQPTTPLVRWEREYRRLLLESCDILDLANLPQDDRHLATRRLELRRLYVPLRVYIEENEQRHPEFIEETLKRFEQQRDYWNRHLPSPPTKRMSIGKHLNDNQRIVILGDPGAGKSTLLRWITTAFLLRYEQNDDWQQLPDVMDLPRYRWLPVLIRCRELSKACINGTLTDMLRHTLRLRELSQEGISQVLLLIEQQLDAGTALLLIDGLDEISTAKERSLFCRQLERIVAKYPATPIIVTSRIVGYREMGIRLGHNFSHVTVADLTKDDKDMFAHCWCDLTELPERKQKAAEELIAQIHGHDRIERLTNNPMLLTTMALIKRKIGRLPQRRIELYSEAVKVLLNWRSEVDEPLDSHEAEPQLQYIAYVMAERGVQRLREDEILILIEQMRQEYSNLHALNRHTPYEFLRLLESRTGLLFEAGTMKHKGRFVSVYEFRHLTFQEYLAGMALVEGRYPRCNIDQLIHKVGMITGLIERKDDSKEAIVNERWREAIRLAVAAWNDNGVDQLLMMIIQPGDPDSLEERRARLIMACQCLADEPNVSDQIVQNIIQAVIQVIDQREEAYFYYASGGDSILSHSITSLYDTRWKDIVQDILIDAYMIWPNAYIGLIVGRTRYKLEEEDYRLLMIEKLKKLYQAQNDIIIFYQLANYFSPRSYRSIDIESRKLLELVIMNGILDKPSIALAAIVLLFTLTKTNIFISLPKEILNIIYQYIRNNDSHYSFVCYGLVIISKYSSYDSYNVIESCLNNSNDIIRSVAIRSIAEINYEKTHTRLVQYITDESVIVRESTIDALRILGNIETVNVILPYLHDENIQVRLSVINALESSEDDSIINILLTCLQDINIYIRQRAIKALGNLGDEQVIDVLINCFNNDDSLETRAIIIEALGNLEDERVFALLIHSLSSEDHGIRRASINALGGVYDERALPLLLECLLMNDNEFSVDIIFALRILGDQRAVETLIEYLRKFSKDEIWYIVSALGDLGDRKAIESIRIFLNDSAVKYQYSIMYALADLGDTSAVDPLLMMMDDTSNERESIITALGKLGDESIYDMVIPFIDSEDNDIVIATIHALSNLGDIRLFEILLNLLSTTNVYLLGNVITALGRLGDNRAVKPLLEFLYDEREKIQCNAIKALGQLGDVQAVEPLLALLTDSRLQVRCSVVDALGRLGEVQAVEPLLALLADSRLQVRCSVVDALGRLGDAQAVEPLLALLTDNRFSIRYSVVEALGRLGDAQAVEPLLALLTDNRGYILSIVIENLGILGNKDIVDSIMKFLNDGRQEVCGSAAYALGRLGYSQIIESLVNYQNDPRILVRMSVLEALRILNVPEYQQGIFSFLLHPQKKIRQFSLALLAQSYDTIDQQLLIDDFATTYKWLDPQRVITERFMKRSARILKQTETEVRLRYERLSLELGLLLEWKK